MVSFTLDNYFNRREQNKLLIMLIFFKYLRLLWRVNYKNIFLSRDTGINTLFQYMNNTEVVHDNEIVIVTVDTLNR